MTCILKNVLVLVSSHLLFTLVSISSLLLGLGVHSVAFKSMSAGPGVLSNAIAEMGL